MFSTCSVSWDQSVARDGSYDSDGLQPGLASAMLTDMSTKQPYEVGQFVVDTLGTGIQGCVEYFTEDGWVGVRDQEDGRLDELPAERAQAAE